MISWATRWLRHSHHRQRNSQSSGYYLVKLRQRRRRLFCRPQFFGICKDLSLSIIWKRVKLLQKLLDCLKAELKNKRLRLVKKKVLFCQNNATGLHFLNRNGSVTQIGLWINSASPLLSKFGSVRLLFVTQFENIARLKEILI